MKTINVASAKGAALDWLVALCEGWDSYDVHSNGSFELERTSTGECLWLRCFRPSTDWHEGGPIMDREEILIMGTKGRYQAWIANKTEFGPTGETHLIAAMRCWVIYKLGETAEVPEELA